MVAPYIPMGMDPVFWERFLTEQDVARQQPTLAFNQQILDLYKRQYEDLKTRFGQGYKYDIPSEFREATTLFQPGGQYGESMRAEASRAANQALAAGQIGLTQTGMSSGTNVAGLRARVAAEEGLARQRTEDERLRLLAGSLQAAGQAGLDVQRLSADEQARLLQVLSSFQPRYIS